MPFVVVARIITTPEYRAIAAHYGVGTARRSGRAPHASYRRAPRRAGRTGCRRTDDARLLSPSVGPGGRGAGGDVPADRRATPDASILALALEYRNIANATLSARAIAGPEDIPLSPLADVNLILIADKIQNRKDFLLHHASTDPRAAELDRYFKLWLERLGVSEVTFDHWRARLTIAA